MNVVIEQAVMLVNTEMMQGIILPKSFNLKQRVLASVFKVDIFEFNKDGDLPIKMLYGYLLHRLNHMRCFYDCAYAAGVSYGGLQQACDLWDKERELNSCMGKSLDVLLSNFINMRDE